MVVEYTQPTLNLHSYNHCKQEKEVSKQNQPTIINALVMIEHHRITVYHTRVGVPLCLNDASAIKMCNQNIDQRS